MKSISITVKFLIIFLFWASYSAVSQNLLYNPDFELYDSIPKAHADWHNCMGAYNLNGNDLMPWGTPDYFTKYYRFDAWDTSGNYKPQFINWLPNTGFAYTYAQSGDAMVGLGTWGGFIKDYREYIQMPLDFPLVVGTTYKVSFWLTNGVKNRDMPFSSDGIGILFSTDSLYQHHAESLNKTPHLEIQGEVWDTVWTQYNFSFVADSAYNYLTMGNFYPDSLTSVTRRDSGSFLATYYFFDNFNVHAVGARNVIAGPDAHICIGDSAQLKAYNDTIYSWANVLTPNNPFSNQSKVYVSPTVTTSYIVYGLTTTDTLTVHVKPTPTVQLVDKVAICDSSSITVSATSEPGNTFLWSNGDTTDYTTLYSGGIHYVKVSNGICEIEEAIEVFQVQCSYDLCLGDSILLMGFLDPNIQWANADNANQIISSNQDVWVKPSKHTTYSLYSSIDTLQITVNVYPKPIVDLGRNRVLCYGDTAVLVAQRDSGTVLLWDDGSTDTVNQIYTPGFHYVDASIGGCVIRYGIDVYSLKCEYFVCKGDHVMLLSFPDSNIAWAEVNTPQNVISTANTLTVLGEENKSYFLYSSIDTLIIDVIVNNKPDSFLGNDTTVCVGETFWITLPASDSTNYVWNGTYHNNSFLVDKPGVIWVEANGHWCFNSDSLYVDWIDCTPSLEMPNVFSPDGNGQNDWFRPIELSFIVEFEMMIYNRWGQVVYQGSSLEGWDGRFEGKAAAEGVYFWLVRYAGNDYLTKEANGTVTLVR